MSRVEVGSPRLALAASSLALVLTATCVGDPAVSAAELPAWCADAARQGQMAIMDSSGVQVVTNVVPAWRGEALDVELQLTIGEGPGGADYEFGRVGDAVRLSDGRIVVGDGQTAELKVFGAAGRFLGRVGGQGGGPGEFRSVWSLHRRPGDSVVVDDRIGRRLTTLDPTFAPAHTQPIHLVEFSRAPSTPGGRPVAGATVYQVRGMFADGSLLAAYNPATGRPPPIETLVTRDTLVLVHVPPGGGPGDSVGIVVGEQRFVYIPSDTGAFAFGPTLLGPVESLAVADDRFYTGPGERFEIEERAPDGRLVRLIRVCKEPDSIPSEAVERAIDRRLAPLPDEVREFEEPALRGLPHPTVAPAYLHLQADVVGGRLWTREFTPPGSLQRWHLFEREGRWLGSVRIPEDVRVLQVGPDWVLAVHTDALGVHSMRLLGFEPPG